MIDVSIAELLLIHNAKTQNFSMVGSYMKDLKKTTYKTVKIWGWVLAQEWVLVSTMY